MSLAQDQNLPQKPSLQYSWCSLWDAPSRQPASCARRPQRMPPDILVCAGAASVIGFTLTGKSLSPQYMVWLLPLTFLIAGRRGIVAIGCAIAAQILTQTYFPIHYWGLVNAHSREITLLAARNLILIVLLVVCWPRANRVAGAGLLAPPDTAQPTST